MVTGFEIFLGICKKKNLIKSFILGIMIKKILIFYILLNILIIPRIIYILIFSKKISINNLIDCNILRLILFFLKKKNKYEKIDTAVYLMLNYTVIFISPLSIKSLKISNTLWFNLEKEIKMSTCFSLKNVFIKTIENEFLIDKSIINYTENLVFFGVKIKITL